jgi:hypothetical protein
MANENLHEKQEDLSISVLDTHRAYTSLIEEIEAIDWYNQKAEAAENMALKEILLHNKKEEIEHVCMLLEWIRRRDKEWNQKMDTYIFKDDDIINLEKEKKKGDNVKND